MAPVAVYIDDGDGEGLGLGLASERGRVGVYG